MVLIKLWWFYIFSMQLSVDIFLQNKSSDFCSLLTLRHPSVSMRIKYSDSSNTSKFCSKYLNSVTAFVRQDPLTGIGATAIKEKNIGGKKMRQSKFVGLGVPEGQNKSNNFIANRCQ